MGDLWISSEALVFDVELEDYATLLLDFLACRWTYVSIIQYCMSERWVSHESKHFCAYSTCAYISSDTSFTITGISLTNKSAGRPASQSLCASICFTSTSWHLKRAFWITWLWNWHLLIPYGHTSIPRQERWADCWCTREKVNSIVKCDRQLWGCSWGLLICSHAVSNIFCGNDHATTHWSLLQFYHVIGVPLIWHSATIVCLCH